MAIESKLPGSRIIQGGKRAILENLNRQKYINRRVAQSGFPLKIKFKTQTEIDNYFSGDRVQCLLCGWWFKSVGCHINKIHDMTVREYKIKYGLPLNRGLSSNELHERLNTIQTAIYEAGINPLSKKENRIKGSAAAKNKKSDYVVQPFNKNRMGETHKFSASSKSKYDPKIVISIINDSELNEISLNDAIKKSPIAKTTFYAWRKLFSESHTPTLTKE